MAYIEFENVKKEYQTGDVKVTAVEHCSFAIEKGELAVILGPSGAGKTTVLDVYKRQMLYTPDIRRSVIGCCAKKQIIVVAIRILSLIHISQEVRQDSFRQIIKMFSLLVIVLPVWCLEIGIWMYLWE